ncbi:patched family protein [Trichuris suis]|nr:patched family protein [Trichuris suis]
MSKRHSIWSSLFWLSSTDNGLADVLENAFQRYGEFVGRHPTPFVLGPIVFTFLIVFGTTNMHVVDDMRELYTPPGSLSLKEHQLHSRFSTAGNDSASEAFFIGVALNDNGNLMQYNYTTAIDRINDYVLKNLTLNIHGTNVSFDREICSKSVLCRQSNHALGLIIDAYFDPKLRNNKEVNLTYPVANIFGNKIYLGGLFGGVAVHNGRIKEVKLIHLMYNYPTFNDATIIKTFEKALRHYLSSLESTGLQFNSFSSDILKSEISRTTMYALPYFPISIALLTALLLSVLYTADPVTSKPVEGLMGLANSLLAIGAAFGFMSLLNIPFNNTVTVVPFITLALAVDDTFILLAAWQQTNPSLSPERRLGLTLKEAGAAITITVTTDIFSFVIGTFSSTPAISSFCLFTVAAILFDYIFQLTFFCAITVLGGRREAAGRHCLWYWIRPASKSSLLWPKVVLASEGDVQPTSAGSNLQRVNPGQRMLKLLYKAFWTTPGSRWIAMAIYALYLGISFYGTCKIRINLTPGHLLVADSPLNRYVWLAENFVYPQGFVAYVYILNAPDFRNRTQTLRFRNFVAELESSTHAVGSDSTTLWLDDFSTHLEHLGAEDEEFYEYLYDFLKLSSKAHWRSHLRIDEEADKPVRQFYFTTGFRVNEWVLRADMVSQWRSISAKYEELQPVVYDEYNFIADQVLSLKTTTLQEVGVAFCCMFLVCAVFIRKSDLLFWVLWSLFSMDVGVIGLLTLWGLDMDPTTVISILMSIGLTVDFTIHMAYHYYRCPVKQTKPKMLLLFDLAGWPLIEGGMCTLLAMLSLVFVPSNVATVFFRTIVLVEPFLTKSMLKKCLNANNYRWALRRKFRDFSADDIEAKYIHTLEQQIRILELQNSFLKIELNGKRSASSPQQNSVENQQVNDVHPLISS